MKLKPKTKLGKWSVYLNIFFLIVILISVILVKLLGVLNFGDRWWDITVLVFISPIIALIIGIIDIKKNKEHSFLVYLSILISILVILFVLLHSLFIND
jgi:hypothetical protein